MDNKELLNAISDVIESKLKQELKPVHDRLDKIENRLDGIENRLDNIENEIVEMKIDLRLVKIATVENAEDLKNLKIVK